MTNHDAMSLHTSYSMKHNLMYLGFNNFELELYSVQRALFNEHWSLERAEKCVPISALLK